MTAEELALQMQQMARKASVDELIKAMFETTVQHFDSPKLKRQIIRALGLQFTLKVMRDDYMENG